ncbi:putative natural product biosynthesis protein, partial [Pseudomonas sp. F1002]|nr:putative natural product biosynthesis protein [Pseudomonas sp. F1002]
VRGVVLAWQGSSLQVVDWKQGSGVPLQNLPPLPGDFAWCALDSQGRFSGWLPVP